MIDISVQVAEALGAAHASGITHRDLKPENIMVNQEGRAKILDFGLAKQTNSSPGVSAEGATATVAITQEGAVLGTMGYMAPEQVRGKSADARTDIFSFGLVMYEMLSGTRAFQRETSADTVSALLKEDPPELPDVVLPGLRQIVQRCLEKEPGRRFQSAADLAFALRSLSAPSGTATTQHVIVPAARRNWVPYIVAATGLAIGAAGWLYRPEAPLPTYDVIPLTSFEGVEQMPALSPDGKQLAFVWAGEPAGPTGVYVKLVSGGTQPVRVSPSGKISVNPCWSPDGTRIAYLRTGDGRVQIMVAPALGGPERRIDQLQPSERVANIMIDWSPDGKWIAALLGREDGKRSLQLVSTETGEAHSVVPPPELGQDSNPRFSPDGKAIAFFRSVAAGFSNHIYRVDLRADGTASGPPARVSEHAWGSTNLAWYPDGRSLLIPIGAGSTIQYWKIPVVVGPAMRLPLQFTSDAALSSRLSLRGHRLAVELPLSQQGVGRIVWDGTAQRWREAPFHGSSHSEDEPQASPDGQWISFCSTRSGSREIWRARPDGTDALQLTSSGTDRVGSPRWSADSRWIAFDSAQDAKYDIKVVSSEGGKTRQVTTGPESYVRPSFSADGQWIYARSGNRLVRVPIGSGAAQPIWKTAISLRLSRLPILVPFG
jgi:Tol biopolymer transport system component